MSPHLQDSTYDLAILGRAQGAIEVKCGTDQSHVSECLGKISQGFTTRSGLLRIEPEMVSARQHFFKQPLCFIEAAHASQRLHQPKGAHVESTFAGWQSVARDGWVVAENPAVSQQPPFADRFTDCVYSFHHHRICRRHEEDKWHH